MLPFSNNQYPKLENNDYLWYNKCILKVSLEGRNMAWESVGSINIHGVQYKVEFEVKSGKLPELQEQKDLLLKDIETIANKILVDGSGYVKNDEVIFSLDGKAIFAQDFTSNDPLKKRKGELEDARIQEIFRKMPHIRTLKISL